MEERERACDEEVLRNGGEPRAYAEGILKICELYLASPLACVAGVTGGDLKRRIEAIMSNRVAHRLNYAKKAILAVAAIEAVVTPIVVGITNTPAVRAQSSPPAPSAVTPRFEVASIKACKGEPAAARPGAEGTKRRGKLLSGYVQPAFYAGEVFHQSCIHHLEFSTRRRGG